MTTEAEKEQEVQSQQEQAGFAAGFSGEEPKEPVKAPEAAKEPEKEEAKEPAKSEEAAQPAPIPALTAEDIAAFRATASELQTFKGQLREAHGKIGALNDLLRQEREKKKEEGKAPTLTAVELKRIKTAFPEMAEDLSADLGEAIAAIGRVNPEDVAKIVEAQVAERLEASRKEDRLERVREVHADFDEVISSDSFREWVKKTATDAQREIVAKSASPKPVIDLVTAFKSHRDTAAKAKEKSQERLQQAITPEGEKRPSGKPQLSDEEAMQKGFAKGFNR